MRQDFMTTYTVNAINGFSSFFFFSLVSSASRIIIKSYFSDFNVSRFYENLNCSGNKWFSYYFFLNQSLARVDIKIKSYLVSLMRQDFDENYTVMAMNGFPLFFYISHLHT